MVNVTVAILSLSSFNDVTMEFIGQLKFQQEWIDNRLQFPHEGYHEYRFLEIWYFFWRNYTSKTKYTVCTDSSKCKLKLLSGCFRYLALSFPYWHASSLQEEEFGNILVEVLITEYFFPLKSPFLLIFSWLTLGSDRSVWTPDTFFHNEQEGHEHTIDRYNRVIRIRHDGHVLYHKRLACGAVVAHLCGNLRMLVRVLPTNLQMFLQLIFNRYIIIHDCIHTIDCSENNMLLTEITKKCELFSD